jgi:colanic acid/amylovoran biosynthesis glycosyltransferase
MRRLLYLLRYYPTLTETFVTEEIKALQVLGEDICIASMGSREDGRISEDLPQLPVYRIPRRPLTGRLGKPGPGVLWLRKYQRPKDAARLPWLVSQIRGKVDLVHVHFAGEAAELAHALHLELGLPYTVMVHATDLFKPRPSLPEVLEAASMVCTVADHHRKHLARMGIEAELLRCGPDLQRWSPLPLPHGPIRALCVARDVPKKGLDDLLQAWRQAPEGARLCFLSDLARSELPPGVEVLGLCPPSEVRKQLAWSNLFILPCKRAPDGDLDGIPVAMMEALACGRPVISTPVSGIPELIDEQVGWLVPAGDIPALVDAIGSASDPEERARRGGRGSERLRDRGFTLKSQATGLQEIWARAGV